MSEQGVPQESWTVHPLCDSWKRSALLFLFLTAIFITVYFFWRSVWVTLFSAILLIGSLYRYFVPFRYELYADELVVTSLFYRAAKPWSDFHSFYVDRNGVLLSPFAKPSRLENFRGLYVRFGSNRLEVIDFIKRKISS